MAISVQKSAPERATKRKPGNAVRAIPLPAEATSNGLSQRDRIVGDIVKGLYEGRYEPGQRLIEAQLTESYGVSRGPVREALNRLAAMGLVDLMPKRGAKVRILSLDEAIDNLIVVQGLVGIAARLAAERNEAHGMQRLEAAVTEIMRFDPSVSSGGYAMARDSFYGALTNLAGNVALAHTLARIHIHLIRIEFRSILRSIDGRRHRDYADIAAAVAAGDSARAERAARAHIGRSIVALRAFKSVRSAD